MSWDNNPYDQPGNFGLELIGTIEWDEESYQFNMTAIWRDAEDSSVLFWASDAGCSCPSPFEDLKSRDDLTTGSRMELQEYLETRVAEKESEEPGEDGEKPYIYGLSREQAQMRMVDMMARVVG